MTGFVSPNDLQEVEILIKIIKVIMLFTSYPHPQMNVSEYYVMSYPVLVY